jgi:dTMP kinase
MMKGRLIVFEGIDGSGTETQSKTLLRSLQGRGVPAARLEYPDYGGDLGKLIRVFLDKKSDLSTEMQFLLYAGDMVKDREKINRWLSEGKTVICDRYFNSTIVYQGIRGFPLEKALKVAEDFGIPKPDIVFLLKITPEESVKRKMGEHGTLDRNEEDRAFLAKVGASYEKMAMDNVFGQWFVIDGARSREDVGKEVMNVLKTQK